MNYFDLFEEKVAKHPEASFLILDGESYTYRVFKKHVLDILLPLEIKGQTVLIQSSCLLFQLCAFLAVQRKNGIPILCHETLEEAEVKRIIKENQIAFYLTKDEMVSQLYKMTANQACLGVLSSGTTGIPKVMYRSFESWASFFNIQNEIFRMGKSDVLFLQGSLSFTGNLNVLLAALFEGTTIVLESQVLPKRWIEQMVRYQVTVVYLVPAKVEVLCNQLKNPLSQIKSLFMGSQLLSNQLIEKLKVYFNQACIQLYYGSSEVSYVTYLNIEELKLNTMRIGRPFPSVCLKLDQNKIYVTTPYGIENIQYPYFTGDLGEIDQEGYLILTGREDDIVNVAGMKVSLLKIEQSIKQVDGVIDVVVSSIPHEMKGHEIVAYVVCESRCEKQTLLSSLQKLERPHHVVVVPEILRNNMGKVIKKQFKKEVTLE